MPVQEIIERTTIRFIAVETPDPFEIEPECVNPSGHHFIPSCGDVVCVHCSKVVWQ